jgi:hypothetical protein
MRVLSNRNVQFRANAVIAQINFPATKIVLFQSRRNTTSPWKNVEQLFNRKVIKMAKVVKAKKAPKMAKKAAKKTVRKAARKPAARKVAKKAAAKKPARKAAAKRVARKVVRAKK